MIDVLMVKMLSEMRTNKSNDKIKEIIIKALSIPDENQRIKVVQNLIYNGGGLIKNFPSDFDVRPYLYSKEIQKKITRMSMKKIKEIINCADGDYKTDLIINNLPYEKQRELIIDDPRYIVYINGENNCKLTKDISSSNFDYYYAADLATCYNQFHLYNTNKDLFLALLKNNPSILSLAKGIESKEIDNYVMTNGESIPMLFYSYCGNNPQVLARKRKIVEDNYEEYFSIVFDQYIGDKLYEFDKQFVMNTFREKFSKDPSFIFKINYYNLLEKKEVYDVIKNYDFTYDQMQSWIPNKYSISLVKGESYYDLFSRLVKKDIRFFSFLCILGDSEDIDFFRYGYNLLKKDFSNIKYIKLRTSSNKFRAKLLLDLIVSNMGKHQEFIEDITGYFYHPRVLKEFQRLLKKDSALLKYYNLNKNLVYDRKQKEAIKSLEKQIYKMIKDDPTISANYVGNNQRILELIATNTGYLSPKQIGEYEFKLDELNNTDSMSTKILLKSINKINPNISEEEIISLFRFLLANNDEILKSINYEMFNEQYYKLFKINNVIQSNLIKIIFRYPEMQKLIIDTMINLVDTNLYEMIFRYILINHPNNLSLIEIVSKTIKEKNNLYQLASSAINNNPDKVDIIIFNTIYLLTKRIEIINISNEDDIINLENKIDAKCTEIISNKQSSLISVREAILMEKYGMTLAETSRIIRVFGHMDKDEPNLNEEELKLLSILESLRLIMECDSVEKLVIISKIVQRNSELKIDETLILEQKLRQMNARHLNQSLTDFSDMKDTHLDDKYGVKIYEAFDEERPHDFMMLVSSLGAYRDTKKPDNYREDWLRPKEEYHSFCTSLISSQLLGIAKIKHCVLGFHNIPLDNLLLSSPTDIGSLTNAMDVISEHCGTSNVDFFFPKKMIDNTRHTHNEVVIERLDKDTKVYPSCVVFTADHFDPAGHYIGKEKKLWENALQAAADLSIPLVVIDRGKVKQYETQIIRGQLDKFKSGCPDCYKLISEIVTRMINMCVGLDNANLWNKNGFNQENYYSIIDEITDTIESMARNNNVSLALKCAEELLICMENEERKQATFNMTAVTRKIYKSLASIREKQNIEISDMEVLSRLEEDRNGKKL